MSTQKPEALRLSAALDELLGYRGINADVGKAASELRRLHAMNEQLNWINQAQEMKLRDLFAAKALQTLLLDNNYDFSDRDLIARKAYAYADAMLKARQA
jgi:hypothetical protein